MRSNDFRLLAAVLSAVILVAPTSAAVRHHGPAGLSAHRASPSSQAIHRTAGHAFHRTASTGGHRHLAHGGAVHASHAYVHRFGHRYGYGGAVVAGTYAGGGYAYPYYGGVGYSYGYGYAHHSCRWYYYHEPYDVPYRCRAHGYAYSYEYGEPSYAVSYDYGYRRFYHHHRSTWSGTWQGGRHPSAYVRANRIHIGHPTHIAGEHHLAAPHVGGAARFARMGGHPKLH
jgi:hypothetical protein